MLKMENKNIYLSRIRAYNGAFSLLEDEYASIAFRERLLEREWSDCGQDILGMRELAIPAPQLCGEAWAQMSWNCCVTSLLPEKTRFMWIKKLIHKLMKVAVSFDAYPSVTPKRLKKAKKSK